MKVGVKEGVIFKEFNSHLLKMITTAMDIGNLLKTTLVITSAADGTHKPESLHYKSLALDFRIFNLSPDYQERFFFELKARLGPYGYDVVKEKDHYHVEYDPK